jgi:hypothetical protein
MLQHLEDSMKINSRAFRILAVVTLVVAVLRYFMKGWVQPLGVSDTVGSFFASVTIVMLIGLVILFIREGRAPDGSYWRGAIWFAALAVWTQSLVIAGIILTARTGKATYYEEIVGSHRTLAPLPHAISHLLAGVIVAVLGGILGLPFYFIARRGRPASATPASQS